MKGTARRARWAPAHSTLPAPGSKPDAAVGFFLPAPPGDCPSIEDILDFCAGVTLAEQAESMQQHLDLCAPCLDLVSGAVHEWAPAPALGWLDVGCNFHPGQHIEGRFRILRFIGRGGMGEVYEAVDLDSSERVALKAVLATSCDSAHLLRSFRREARLGRKVRHPNVCRIHPAQDRVAPARARVPYFTMEFIDGCTLHEQLARVTLSIDAAVAIAQQVLLGLRAIHQAGLLHLDLKSSNVMLRQGSASEAVIVDFGLARGALAAARSGPARPITGSLPYMPPEQLLGHAPGLQNDVFAFGVVLFQMLTGQLPFPNTQPSTNSTIVRRLVARAPRPSQLVADIPPWLDDVVLTCLAEQEARFADVDAVLQALASR